MICNKCNNTVPNDSEYCPFCGNIIEQPKDQNKTVSEVDKGYKYLELKQWKKAAEIFDFAIVNDDSTARAYIGKLLAKLKLCEFSALASLKTPLSKYDEYNLALKYADDEYMSQLEKLNTLCEEKYAKKKARTKIGVIISSLSLVVAVVLTYFVFIPVGRYAWYNDKLSDTKVAKAVKSYSNSKYFEYDDKVKELFYNKGIEFVQNKDYTNAEKCFEITRNVADGENYYNYCKAQNLLADNDLESYNYFVALGDFLDCKEILNTNEYFVVINKLQGKWSYPETPLSVIDAHMLEEGYTIDYAENVYLKKIESDRNISLCRQRKETKALKIEINGIKVSGDINGTILISDSHNYKILKDDDSECRFDINDEGVIHISGGNFYYFIEWTKVE